MAVAWLLRAAFGRPDEARLVEQLHADGDATIALVAEERGAVVGHIMMSRLEAPFPALALAPLAVTPRRQRSGIGAALVRAALGRARSGEWHAAFVLGDAEYYGRFGFDPALAAGFASPYAGPHFMALALRGDLPSRKGGIIHARAFSG